MEKMKKSHPYVLLARETVTRHLAGEALPSSGFEIDADESLWKPKRACFVSIKTVTGDLRGCIGTISPMCRSLDSEIITNAVSASTRDTRFPAMTSKELGGVRFSVDVLGTPEEVSDKGQLDPRVWGVIVSKGAMRGVLLPDLEGVDTVDYQLGIAANKAGIHDLKGAVIERFSVSRYMEDDGN